MKTVKFLLITAFVSFTMMSYSATKYDPMKAGVNIAVETAMQNTDLFTAMIYQVNEDMLNGEQRGFYVARVIYNGQAYFIHGDLKSWQAYFIQSKWVGFGGNLVPIKVDRYTF